MLRPNVRVLIKDHSLNDIINIVEVYIKECQGKEYYLANIDLLRLYGKSFDSERFYKLALYLTTKIKNASVFREVSRYSYFVEKKSELAKHYANIAISLNVHEPLWVYYIAEINKDYYEEIYKDIYLTSIPKNASTSLKSMVLNELHKKSGVNPHSVFGNPFFKTNDLDKVVNNNALKLLSIREPMARFTSYHTKNVIEESSLKEELGFTDKEKEFGLDLKPSLENFTENLNLYCYVFNDVLHHILPQSAYFSSLDKYDCIADITESNKLSESVSKKLGFDQLLQLPKKMVSTKSVSSISIGDKEKEIISNLFYDDFFVYANRKLIKKTFSFKF